MFEGMTVVSYTRAEAIEDGELVDLSESDAAAGYMCPVAVTRRVWEECCEWDEADAAAAPRAPDLNERLAGLLAQAKAAIQNAPMGADRASFRVHFRPRAGRPISATPTVLDIVHGPGDDGAPVITIMFPGED